MSETAAFIGLGVMGAPMAGHLASAGHAVSVYNRTHSKADGWLERHAGKVAATPAADACDADFVFTCVGNDDDLRAVALGDDGVLATLAPGGIFVDHSTTSATVARELHAAAARQGVAFIDAPVSGGEAGAVNGQLTVMCGGDGDVFERVKPLIDNFAKQCMLIGDTGAGQLTKMVNQICIAGLVQGLSEAMNFGAKSGLDMEKVIQVIGGGAAQSWQLDNRANTMVDGKFDFGFAVEWMRKDLGICLGEAKNNGARLPVTALVDQFYSQVEARGGKRWDTSSLIHLLAND